MRYLLFKRCFFICIILGCSVFVQAQVVVRMPKGLMEIGQERLSYLCSMDWLSRAIVEDVASMLSGRYGPFLFFSWNDTLLNSYCDDDNNTILHIALVARANTSVIRILIASGASLDVENAFGITPEDIRTDLKNKKLINIASDS